MPYILERKNSHELFKENKSLQRNLFPDEALVKALESQGYALTLL